ncbi:MAG: helix-turn-helix domain-containing protein [Agathobacter sp.]|nr:helix-turn-helix domain-containing protein [Agathobacter sp.]
MQEQIRLYLNEQNYKEDLEHLQEVLADVGINLSIENKTGYSIASFDFDRALIKERQNRSAGRKRLDVKELYTYGDILKMREKMTTSEIAKSLNLSRTTLYRRMKEHEEKGSKESDLF